MSTEINPTLEAALKVFARYGLNGTTMQLIAGEARVSRQTLYDHYGNKEGIIQATILYLTDRLLAQARADCATQPDLGGQLWAFFQRAVIEIYDLVQGAPDAEEMLAGGGMMDTLRESEARKTAFLAELLTPYEDALLARHQSARRVAGFTVNSMIGIKHGAGSRDELLARLDTLHRAVLILADREADARAPK